MSDERYKRIAEIVCYAGGEIVGRTRFQKIVYLLTAMGLEDEFSFVYKHYCPYSDELAHAAKEAALLDFIGEEEKVANWGGVYSIYKTINQDNDVAKHKDASINQFVSFAANSDAIELELTATAVFLSKEGISDPWKETARRKPEKADADRLQRAKELYDEFRKFSVSQSLPDLN
ncbi:hypothetical protein [uncultured Bartonella sp.]|uniref:hypothetical protein n=1 Tax=uncultured Bartonella sp. TaxID=104108 RepID=UPI00262E22F5|nr:hypothetical protein [uncultured Bartonella sp.]